jgi:NitT/TauT family transport system permease protein
MSTAFMRQARPWLVTIGLIVLWEASCRLFSVPTFVLPTPSQILDASIQFSEPLFVHGLQTLLTTVAGFGIAIVVGILLGEA